MRYTTLIPLVVGATAFALPGGDIFKQISLSGDPEDDRRGRHDADRGRNGDENRDPHRGTWWEGLPERNDLVSSIENLVEEVANGIENTIDSALDIINKAGDTIGQELGNVFDNGDDDEDDDENNGGRRRRRPNRGNDDKTIYELIKESKSTRRFAELVDKHRDIKELLQETKQGRHTVFVPTDRAFEEYDRERRGGRDSDDEDREWVEELLAYHVVRGSFALHQLQATRTLPTELELRTLGHHHQRLRVAAGLYGLRLNFYSKVVAADFRARNGIIHAVDWPLIPPPRQGRLIDALPGKFSTLSLAMERTQLGDDLHDRTQRGGTVFAPTNLAFIKLGPRTNAFLFSRAGEPYLRALLRYHIVVNETLYSDAYYDEDRNNRDRNGRDRNDRDRDDNDRNRDRDDNDRNRDRNGRDRNDRDRDGNDRNRGDNDRNRDGNDRNRGDNDRNRDRNDRDREHSTSLFDPVQERQVELQSILGDKLITVDFRRWMGVTSMTVNGRVRVALQDAIADDGVIQVVESVLIPPRGRRHDDNGDDDDYENDRLSIGDLKNRLHRYLDDDDDNNRRDGDRRNRFWDL